MAHYHPSDSCLVEFAAGTLDRATAIAVSAHLHYCKACRARVNNLEQIGGALMYNVEPVPVTTSFDSLMNAIDELDQEPKAAMACSEPQNTNALPHDSLPPVISHLMSQQTLSWRKVTRHLQTACLVTGQKEAEVSLQKICAGAKVPAHDHRGIELTLVLQGSFSDDQGLYQPGDFLLKNPGEVHQPHACSNEDCLCLTVQNAPIRMTGAFHRLFNPFLSLRAS